MAIRQRVYLVSVNDYNEPRKAEGKDAISIMLIRLLTLNPGSDPLHPEMGVGIGRFKFKAGSMEELRKRIQNQIETYLPDFQYADVTLVRNPNKTCNVEINIDDTIYVYDSNNAPIPILIDDIVNN